MRIAVVGAGITGLTCAYRLQRAGHDPVVFERERGVGGRMATVMLDGRLRVDVGANLLLENFRATRALVRELGLESTWHPLRATESGGILRDGVLAPFSPRTAADALRFQGLSMRGRVALVRFLAHAAMAHADLRFFDLSSGYDPDERADAASFLRARYGDEIVDWLADPFVRTFHFHGADRISTRYFDALGSLVARQDGFVPAGLDGGMATLPSALASRLHVERGAEVRAIVPASDGLRVLFDGRETHADAVVVATTATVAERILEALPDHAALARSVAYSSTVMCGFRVARHAAPDFEGIWVPRGESRLICCCANEACKGGADADEVAFVIGLHEEAARDLASEPDGRVLARVEAEWCRLFPRYAGAMRGAHVQRWPEALPVYGPGAVARVRRFWDTDQGRDGVWLAGDYMNHPWIEGSIRCAEKIAERIGPRFTPAGFAGPGA